MHKRQFNYKIVIILTLLLGTYGCTSTTKENLLEDPNAIPENNLSLIDSEVFDYKLGLALAKNLPSVTVKVISPFTANKIPERIEKWISAVNDNGGKVEIKPDPGYTVKRGILSEVIDLALLAYDAFKKSVLYKTTDDYDATLFYIQDNGNITKVVFILKKEAEDVS